MRVDRSFRYGSLRIPALFIGDYKHGNVAIVLKERIRKKKIASSAAGLCALALSSRGRTIYVTLQPIALIKVVARKYDRYVRQLKVTLKVTTHVPLAGTVA